MDLMDLQIYTYYKFSMVSSFNTSKLLFLFFLEKWNSYKFYFCVYLSDQNPKRILEWNLLEKTVERPFCCTVFILQVYFTYLCFITFWALDHHFIKNLKLILKENQIMKKAGFIIDQWSFHIDFTNDDFPL